jgi:chaperonin GroES
MEMFLPIEDNVVLQKATETGQTAGGVIIPDTTQEGTLQGEIIAVGPGRNLENGDRTHMQCKVGDIVVYPKYGARELEIDNEDYLIIKEKELLTILEQ